MAVSKKSIQGQLLIENKVQIFYCFIVCFITLLMVLAYKTSGQVWRGIHDTLVYKNSVVVFLYGASALIMAAMIALNKNYLLTRDKLSLCLYVLVLFASLSFFWAERPGFATHKTLMWASSIMAFVICLQFVHNDRLLHILLRVLFLAAVIVAAIGLLQALFNYRGVPQATPPASTYSNKNMACHPIILAFPIGIYLLFGFKDRAFYKDLIYAIGLALMLSFVYHTQTRAAWLALALELLFIFSYMLVVFIKGRNQTAKPEVVFYINQSKRIVVGIGILILLLLMSLRYEPSNPTNLRFENPILPVLGLVDRSIDSVSTIGHSGSFGVRKKIWTATAEVIKENPLFGQGMGNFYIAYTRHYLSGIESIRRAHNDYLEMIAEIGLVGFAVFFAALVLSLYYLLAVYRSPQTKNYRFLIVCISALFIGTAENAFFSFPYFHITPPIMMGIYMSILVCLFHKTKTENASLKLNNGGVSAYNLTANKTLSIVVIVVLILFACIAIRAKYYVEHMEKTWTEQIKSGSWKHIDLGSPRWLETTHYNPVLQGMYGALMGEVKQYQNLAKKEPDFNKRFELQKQKVKKEKLMEDIALNANEYRPQYSFLINLASYYLSKNQIEKAKQQLQQAQKVKAQGNLQADFMLIKIVRKTQGKEQALKELDALVKRLSPEFLSKNTNSYLDIGFQYYQLGVKAKALTYFEKSITHFPQISEAYKNIAVIYINAKRIDFALPYMKRYINHPSGSPQIKKQFKHTIEKYNKSKAEPSATLGVK